MTEIQSWSHESAQLYDLNHRADDYRDLAEQVHGLVQPYSPGATSLLDVACCTGRYLEELRRGCEVEGVDSSPAMLELARERLPDVPLHQADMREFDLGRTIDAVTCFSSSIASVLTLVDLDRAVTNMARYQREGGVLVLELWDPPEDADPSPWVTTAEEAGRVVSMMETTELNGERSLVRAGLSALRARGSSRSRDPLRGQVERDIAVTTERGGRWPDGLDWP